MKTNNHPIHEDAMAFLADELPEEARKRFADQLAGDADLREEVAGLQSIRARLLALPESEPSPDLSRRIMHAIRAGKENESGRKAFRPNNWPAIAALAACLVLGLALLGQLLRPAQPGKTGDPSMATSDPHREKAVAWLVANQDTDGSWDVTRWGGSPKFKIALTALSTLALLECAPSGDPRLEAAARAGSWLATQQSPDGTFGPDFQGAPYNHAMATMALLQLHRLAPERIERTSLDRAIAAITRRQFADGAWGYQSLPFRGDHSITEWNLAALEQAASDGWSGLGERATRARVWMSSRPRDPDAVYPGSLSESLAGAGANPTGPDLYAAYFKVRALLDHPDAGSLDELATLRQSLCASQEASGDLAGSWPPEDRWSAAGGRLYSTAMATLALAGR
jgi:hypothetical protein